MRYVGLVAEESSVASKQRHSYPMMIVIQQMPQHVRRVQFDIGSSSISSGDSGDGFSLSPTTLFGRLGSFFSGLLNFPPPTPRGEQDTVQGLYNTQEGADVCGAFSAIDGLDGAQVINEGFQANCAFTSKALDDGGQVIDFPFEFKFFGAETGFSKGVLTTNGALLFVDEVFEICDFNASPIQLGDSDIEAVRGIPRIQFAKSDLEIQEGDKVVLLATSESMIISYEPVDSFGATGSTNAQLELYPNGDFDIRWGDVTLIRALSAGAESEDLQLATPANLASGTFDSVGVESVPSNLSNLCLAFFAPRA